MKFLQTFLFVNIVFQAKSSFLDDLTQDSFVNSLTEVSQDICPDYTEKFNQTINNVTNCLLSPEFGMQTICARIESSSLSCNKPLIKLLEDCLPEKYKSSPLFLMQSFTSVMKYLCQIPGEQIFELMNACAYRSAFQDEKYKKFWESQLGITENSTDSFPTTDEICRLEAHYKNNFEVYLPLSCSNNKTIKAFVDIIDAAMKPCSDLNKTN